MGCISSSPDSSEMPEALHTNSEMTTAPRHTQSTKVEHNHSKIHKKDQSDRRSTKSSNSLINDRKEEHSRSVSMSWDLDADLPDERKVEFQLKISQKQSQLEEEAKQLKILTAKSFEAQVSKQKEKAFVGLYDLFKQHATNGDKMDINGVTEALKEFGMIIDNDRNLQRFVFSAFDIDNEREIDYNDFMATMSSLIGTKTEETLLLLFQIFDIDQDGYLTTEDIARLVLAENQIAVVVTGHAMDNNANTVTLTKRQCLKLARGIITKYEANNTHCEELNEDKISFNVFQAMMMKVTTEKMMIDNLSVVPSMDGVAIAQGN